MPLPMGRTPTEVGKHDARFARGPLACKAIATPKLPPAARKAKSLACKPLSLARKPKPLQVQKVPGTYMGVVWSFRQLIESL